MCFQSVIASLGNEIHSYPEGEDPIALYEKKIETLQTDGEKKSADLAALRKLNAEEFVPRAGKERAEAALKDVEVSCTLSI